MEVGGGIAVLGDLPAVEVDEAAAPAGEPGIDVPFGDDVAGEIVNVVHGTAADGLADAVPERVVSISGGGAAVNGDEAVFGVIGVAVEGVVNQRAEESVRSPIRSTPRPTFKHRRWGTRLMNLPPLLRELPHTRRQELDAWLPDQWKQTHLARTAALLSKPAQPAAAESA